MKGKKKKKKWRKKRRIVIKQKWEEKNKKRKEAISWDWKEYCRIYPQPIHSLELWLSQIHMHAHTIACNWKNLNERLHTVKTSTQKKSCVVCIWDFCYWKFIFSNGAAAAAVRNHGRLFSHDGCGNCRFSHMAKCHNYIISWLWKFTFVLTPPHKSVTSSQRL